MLITGIETIPLRIPHDSAHRSAASVWGAAGSPAVDSLLVKLTTDQGLDQSEVARGRCGRRRNYDGLAQVRSANGIPIAAGENVLTLMDLDRILRAGSVDFVQPGPAKMGGVTELCRAVTVASVRSVPVVPHSFYDGAGVLAAVHVAAALGTADSMIEWRCLDLEAHVYGDMWRSVAGRIRVPEGPGLGFDPDPGVIAAYRQLD